MTDSTPTTLSPFNWGYMNAVQDDCENAPFASSGGMDKRLAMEAPEYVPADKAEEFLRGYRAYCHATYGPGWETGEWGWVPVLEIDPSTGMVRAIEGDDE